MINYRTLETHELEDWFNLCGCAFEEPSEYFKNHFYNDPWRDIDSIFVAEKDSNLIGTVRVFHRKIYCENKVLTLGGIGEVCTRFEYRKQGISTKLLNMAILYMKNKGFDLSCLETGTHDHYNKLGWQTIKQIFNTSKIKASDHFDHIIKPINFMEQKELSDLFMLYKDYCSTKFGPLVRSLDYFKTWIKHEASKNTGSWLVYSDTFEALAYIIFNVEKEFLHIKEFSAINGQEDLIDTLIPYIIHKIGKKDLNVNYPSQIMTSFKVTKTQPYEGYMLKTINNLNKDIVYKLKNNLLFLSLDSF
ncbi:GNAT family N-acetyltransferase [Haloplasma contractile]|uniref:GCN5-like N-acetyltransferase protein n=1 Tax=Haloplasma contractile SSD-17B TaxID=1033810 RepID=U2FLT5_9MOLU|nr:GNAT family N-acetyltransferase [Haloplasma contractile]ERJ12149.1 GCN5-like N-acetyltransferase protein [Haloplasma contractile SSD-17B]